MPEGAAGNATIARPQSASPMRPSDIAWLVFLAALWGSSFIFLRIAALEMDPGWIAFLRTGLSALAVLAYTAALRLPLAIKQHWRAYLIVGSLNASLPWLLYSYAGKTLPASYMVMMNSLTPIFVVLFSAGIAGERVTATKIIGMLLGFAGVAMIVGLGPLAINREVMIAVALCLVSVSAYALGGIATRRYGREQDSRVLTAGSMLLATPLLLPTLGPAMSLDPASSGPSMAAIVSLLALGVGSSGFGYLVYYRLVTRVGATRALTVTYLMPLFGTFYGVVLLGEPFGIGMAAGAITVLLATALVTGLIDNQRGRKTSRKTAA